MNSIYYCSIVPKDKNNNARGLCNQLFALTTGIIMAIKTQKKMIIVDNFLVDYQKDIYTNISQVIDMNRLNNYLKNNYNISIYDKNFFKFNLQKENFIHTFKWINEINKELFDVIMSNFVFTPFYHNFSFNFFKKHDIDLNANTKINVLHLRLEDDAIIHWSKMNNKTLDLFKNILTQKYIEVIKTYINKDEMNIILSYSTNNEVIAFLKANQYPFCFTDKIHDAREMNAVADLTIGSYCNNLFIGNFNLTHLNGSSFSYFLLNKYDKYKKNMNIKTVLIDLDRIDNIEYKNF
jgi:hypothetical protein